MIIDTKSTGNTLRSGARRDPTAVGPDPLMAAMILVVAADRSSASCAPEHRTGPGIELRAALDDLGAGTERQT